MFNYPQISIDRLKKQRDEIDNLISSYQQMPPQQPINNIINTPQSQTPTQNLIEWRILNENEDVDNLYVNNKTFFVGENKAILKDVDGKLEKWEIKKIYPIDKKDEKINQLEEEIRKLKEMINCEYSKPNKSNDGEYEPNGNDDGNVKPKSKTSSRTIQE